MNHVLHKIILILTVIFSYIFPISVGSDSAFSRQANTTFPTADGDNEMKGFAAFEGGFSLEDQMGLFDKLVKDFNKKYVVYCSKADLVGKEKIKEFGGGFNGVKVFYEADKLKKYLTLTP